MRHSDRVERIVDSLTREEKLSLVRGAADPEGLGTGYLPGVERLDVPELRLVDGPLGVRVEGEPSTAFPASIAAAATFDPELARRQGAAMAREATARGPDVLLAPGLNLIRVPHNGRNFEYYSEDPLVTGAFAAAAVEGIQSEGVLATPKHYVANNQETRRAEVSAEVSERALRELYLPGFCDAVDAGARAVMTAYNRVNGTYASDHEELVAGVLKEEWGFDGMVMSDWYGTASTVGAANGGLDLEMPGVPPEGLSEIGDDEETDPGDAPDEAFDGPVAVGLPDPTRVGLFGEALGEAVDAGEVPESRLDDMAARVLGGMKWAGLLESRDREGALDTPEHREVAREIAARGAVLLENDGLLPLDEAADVAVIGPNVEEVTLGGGGSSETDPFDPTTTAEGVRERAGGDVTVRQGSARILTPSFFDLMTGEGEFGQADEDVDREAALEAAADADAAVVVVRDWATEARDREDLRLPGDQDDLVRAVADANDRTVAVVQSSGPVELPWRHEVAALVEAWYPGQADGEALAAVLYGDVDASGRLPVTFAPEDEYPASEPHQFPGDDEVHYEEGVFVGYRHFDAGDAEPTYPFGYGQSYAAFEYRDLAVEDGTVRATVANVADRDGREVVQAYVRPPASGVERPERELGGFAAVDVPAGEIATVDIDLDERAFAYWDDEDGWTVESGAYAVEVGRSSRDLRLSATVER